MLTQQHPLLDALNEFEQSLDQKGFSAGTEQYP